MNNPVWLPSQARVDSANITQFCRWLEQTQDLSFTDYEALHAWSVQKPEIFWKCLWDYFRIINSKAPEQIVRYGARFQDARWFCGAELNFAENLLRIRDDRIAISSWLESGKRQSWTCAELYLAVAKFSTFLQQTGVKPGDRVAGLMPNIGETTIAMLATTTIGAVWTSCSPDFGNQGVIDRFGQTQPTVLICTDGYIYNGKSIHCLDRIAAIAEAIPCVKRIVIVPLLNATPDMSSVSTAISWADASDNDATDVRFAQLAFNHPLYIMYSSGTTGKPKCIVHSVGGTLLQHLKELSLHTDLKSGEAIFYYTTCGWMMWNWLISSLVLGATIVQFDGSPFAPGPEVLWNISEHENVSIFGTSAKYLSALEKAGYRPREHHDLSRLKSVLSTGSPLAHESYDFVYQAIHDDVCLSSISGGTDIISCFALGNPALPVYRGELQCKGLGMAVEIWNDEGSPVIAQKGELVCTHPFPSMPIGFWNDTDGSRYQSSYFDSYPDIWAHGDYAEETGHGGIIIFGRSDTVLNPGGVRIGTAEIYRQVEQIEEVLESVVVGQEWDNDTRVILFVRLRDGLVLDDTLRLSIKQQIRQNTTPRHVLAIIE